MKAGGFQLLIKNWRVSTIKKVTVRVNDQIKSPQLRVIDTDGRQAGVLSRRDALLLAEERGLDLVEISPNSNPPVCKVMDFGKYKYELSKKEKIQKKKQHVIHIKEIRLRPSIEEHDFDFKIKNARKFIIQGNKVKVNVLFKGRELIHQDFGKNLINRLTTELEDIAKPENPAKLEGRNLILYLIKK